MTDLVSFTQMRDGTRADYELLHRLEREYIDALPERLLQAVARLGDGLAGYRVSRLEHSVQAATRARRDGAEVEWVVAALLHDIGDELAPENHAQMAAAVLRPYVAEEVTWVVNMHGLFQMAYYGHHLGLDPDAREAYRGHRWFDRCVHFCQRWDQASFDPAYRSDPLESFADELREVFGHPAFADMPQ